jgi:hypothetical protein
MRGSRAILYAQRLSELTSQLSELEDLRNVVEEAERRAHGVPPLRLTHPPSRRLRSRKPAMSVRLRRHAPLSGNAGALSPPDNDNQVDWTLLEPFPEGWSAWIERGSENGTNRLTPSGDAALRMKSP